MALEHEEITEQIIGALSRCIPSWDMDSLKKSISEQCTSN